MENRRYLQLAELLVWSDNPRHGPQDKENISEIEAINILIDVVGTDKMYNLIADIFASKGLMGNVNPVVVFTDDRYYVYDGNRRVSALKIINNPSIVEDAGLRKKVIALLENEDISFIDTVFVYITDENEALEIMDKTHSGEQQGVGMISWEPYQRDYSLARRGKSLIYPYAYGVAKALGYNIRSFETISYTDLNRLFGSTVLRDHFNLLEENPDYSKIADYVVGMLIKYKQEKKFRSFSREFNITDPSNEGPIVKFCNWVDEQEKNRKNFYFKSQAVELFVDETFSLDLINLQILDINKKAIPYDNNDLTIIFITPNGVESTIINMKETGTWELLITFKGEQHSEKVIIKELLAPKIDFVTTALFGKGNTIDLRKLMIRAMDGHGNEKFSEVIISADNHVEIINDVFTTKNPLGAYQIAYSFVDITRAPYSVTKEIKIIDKSNPLLPENREVPLLSFNGSSKLINISEVVNKLVSEINNLNFEDNICLLTISLRTLLELSFDELHSSKKLVFSQSKDLELRIKEFKDYLLQGNLSTLCTTYSEDLPSFTTERNSIIQIEPDKLSSLLHLATHKSISRIELTKIAETARKVITPILVYISLILK